MTGSLILLSGGKGKRLRLPVFVELSIGATVSLTTFSWSLPDDSSPLTEEMLFFGRPSSRGPLLEHLCAVLIGILSLVLGTCEDGPFILSSTEDCSFIENLSPL